MWRQDATLFFAETECPLLATCRLHDINPYDYFADDNAVISITPLIYKGHPVQAPLQAKNDSDAAQTDTARTVAQKRGLADNRPEAVAQRKLAETMNTSPRVLQQRALSDAIHNNPRTVAQRHQMNALFGGAVKPQGNRAIPTEASPAQREEKINNTGLPNQLKSGIESLSGMSMDHIKVHYNSDKPARLQAHAYAQGSEIHLGVGQERHLPHEAWHVVQQAQGRVRPTLQMKAGAINDDPSLEKEADMMGEKAAQFKGGNDAWNPVAEDRVAGAVAQHVAVFQRVRSSSGAVLAAQPAIAFNQTFADRHIARDKAKARTKSTARGADINTVAPSDRWRAAIAASSTWLPADGNWVNRIAKVTCKVWVFRPVGGVYTSPDAADKTVWVGGAYTAATHDLAIDHLES